MRSDFKVSLVPTIIILLLLCVGVERSHAGNFSLSISKDTRRVIDVGTFGYGNTGVFELTIGKLELDETEEYSTVDEKIGFTLDRVPSTQYARQEKNYGKGEEAEKRVCFIDDPAVVPEGAGQVRFAFPLEKKLSESKNALTGSLGIVRITEPGLYALFFYNCKKFGENKLPKPAPVHVTLSVDVSQYNVLDDERSYLAIGATNLPMLYLLFTLLYLVLFVVWTRTMGENRMYVHKIHYLMAFLLLIKALSLLLDAAKFYTHKRTGQPSFWDYVYYIVLTFKGITLFTVILLLGSGWSFLRPFVPEREKKILLALLPLQIIVNISIAVLEETSEGNPEWASWGDTLRVVDIVCCCAVLLPVVWSLKSMRDASQVSGKVARARVMLRQFRTFYIFVVCFIYYTRIVVVLIENALPYKDEWMSAFFAESGIVLFYTYTGIRFQPMEKNPHLQLDEDDLQDERVQQELKEAEAVSKDKDGNKDGKGRATVVNVEKKESEE
eukprot:PhM_4_TR15125/c0_g1_i1/m.103823